MILSRRAIDCAAGYRTRASPSTSGRFFPSSTTTTMSSKPSERFSKAKRKEPAMSVVRTEKAPAPKGPYSQGRTGGGLVFVAGQGPFDATGTMVGKTIAEQTPATLENVKAIV